MSDSQPLSDTLAAGGSVFTLAEKFNIFGRSEGYALSNLTVGAEALIAGTMQAYDTAGRLAGVAVSGAGEFAYDRLPGSDLVQTLAMPNGVTRETVFDQLRGLPASVTHTNANGTVLTHRTYAHDPAARLMQDDCHQTYYPNSHETDENLSDGARAYVWVINNKRKNMNLHCGAFIKGKR